MDVRAFSRLEKHFVPAAKQLCYIYLINKLFVSVRNKLIEATNTQMATT